MSGRLSTESNVSFSSPSTAVLDVVVDCDDEGKISNSETANVFGTSKLTGDFTGADRLKLADEPDFSETVNIKGDGEVANRDVDDVVVDDISDDVVCDDVVDDDVVGDDVADDDVDGNDVTNDDVSGTNVGDV